MKWYLHLNIEYVRYIKKELEKKKKKEKDFILSVAMQIFRRSLEVCIFL